MVRPRSIDGAVLLQNGKVLIVGSPEMEGPDPGAEIYDPATNRFGLTGSMMSYRANCSVALLRDGRVLVAGGLVYDGSKDVYLSSAEIYDPATNTFMQSGSLHTAREHATATVLADGRVLIAGGDQWVNGRTGVALDSAEIYDPVTSLFSVTGSLHLDRLDGTATLLADGRVLFAGGGDYKGGYLSQAETYDPSTGKFSYTGSMIAARAGHTATLLLDGRVLVTGGGDQPASSELYDPSTGKFSRTGDMTTGRAGHSAVLLRDGRVLLVAGDQTQQACELYWP
jgi:Galactose oxidase, central domain